MALAGEGGDDDDAGDEREGENNSENDGRRLKYDFLQFSKNAIFRVVPVYSGLSPV